MHKNWFKVATVAVALVAGMGSARAALDSSDEGYAGPFIDLSSRILPSGASDVDRYGYTFGPVELPGMVFTRTVSETNSGLGAVLGQGSYRLATNGGFSTFSKDALFAGIDGPGGYMQFTITGSPVSSFGAYVNYSTETVDSSGLFDFNPYIAAIDRDGNVLESWDLAFYAPISTPGALNPFVFRGIERDSADIFALRLGNAFVVAAGRPDGGAPTGGGGPIDPTVPPVPEPQTYVLMLAGLGVVALVARRRLALSRA